MFTHEYLTIGANGGYEHESYASAFEVANDVCRAFPGEETPQDVLDILADAKGVIAFGPDREDRFYVRELPEPLYLDNDGELCTSEEIQRKYDYVREMNNHYDSINRQWWSSVDRNSRVW